MNLGEGVLTEEEVATLPVKAFVSVVFRHSSKEVTYSSALSPADFLAMYTSSGRKVKFIGGNGKFVFIDKHDVVGMIVSPKV